MIRLLKRLLGAVDEENEAGRDPKVSAQKLEEAEEWTAGKRGEIEDIKRELARYEVELKLIHGISGAHDKRTGRARRPPD